MGCKECSEGEVDRLGQVDVNAVEYETIRASLRLDNKQSKTDGTVIARESVGVVTKYAGLRKLKLISGFSNNRESSTVAYDDSPSWHVRCSVLCTLYPVP